jgi:glycosyltransferase involved in cell wall biosynthesis
MLRAMPLNSNIVSESVCSTVTAKNHRSALPPRRVAVLMAVFNGAAFLPDQIATLARQSVAAMDVWASDDGSKDGSVEILKQAALAWKKGSFHVIEGPGKGFAENFRFLLTQVDLDADYVAFCDQDDLWEEDKIAVALEWLEDQREDRPALFCGRTRIVARNGEDLGFSPAFTKPPSFRNALVQSIAGANTIVMNRRAWKLVRDASRRVSFIVHDWWCYLLVTGAGGIVHYSLQPKVNYRQHQNNAIGENQSWRSRLARFRYLMEGRFARWNDRNVANLEICSDLLTADARETVRLFSIARSAPPLPRLVALIRSRVYRQTFLAQTGLYFACVLRKL